MIFLPLHLLFIVPAIVFGSIIAIVAIVGGLILEAKKLQYSHQNKNTDQDDELKQLKKQLLYLEAEQDTLIHRIEQLEKSGRAQGLEIPETEEKIKIETKPFLRDNLGK